MMVIGIEYFIIMVKKKPFFIKPCIEVLVQATYPWPNLMAHALLYYVMDK